MMRKIVEKKGITLIALVITIIVLLILAGITINLTIGNKGILKMAEQAGQNYTNAEKYEKEQLARLTNEMGEHFITSDRTTASLPNNITFPQVPEVKSGTIATNTVDYGTYTTVNSYTVEKTGLYTIGANFGWGNTASYTGYMCIYLYKNDTAIIWDQRNSIEFNYTGFGLSSTCFLNKGDVVKIVVYQKGPSTVTVTTDGYNILNLTPIYYVEKSE